MAVGLALVLQFFVVQFCGGPLLKLSPNGLSFYAWLMCLGLGVLSWGTRFASTFLWQQDVTLAINSDDHKREQALID